MVDTKQKIIEAAIIVLNEDLSAPLERVAEKAAVTRRTLHRYFRDREELMLFCERDMERSCRKAMTEAFNRSENPLEQLEYMLYAGIDCGVKHTFFHKLHHLANHQHNLQNKDCAEYEALYEKYRQLILGLQKKEIVDKRLTPDWILALFSAVLNATNHAGAVGRVAKADLKRFAWFSFSKGIGL